MHGKWLLHALLLPAFFLIDNTSLAQTSTWDVRTSEPTETISNLTSSGLSVTNDGPDCITILWKESNGDESHEYTVPADGEPHLFPPEHSGSTIIQVAIKICSGTDKKASGSISF